MSTRGQSHVVGVALMLGIAVLAIGTLTVGIGQFVDAQTASADATRLVDGMDTALQAAETTGPRTRHLQFAGGQLGTVDRDLRVLRNGSVVATRPVGGLVFEARDRRVAFLAGAIVRGRGGDAWLARGPSVTDSERNAVVLVGAPVLGTQGVAVSGRSGTRVALRTNVTHSRLAFGPGRYAVAVETATPSPFERYFRERGADVDRRDFDGDGIESIVARYPGDRRGYMTVHNLSLEVGG